MYVMLNHGTSLSATRRTPYYESMMDLANCGNLISNHDLVPYGNIV